jgi:hypothetical protein
MERVGRWALIIKWKNRKTEWFGEDLEQLRFGGGLFFRNKNVPPAGKTGEKMRKIQIFTA